MKESVALFFTGCEYSVKNVADLVPSYQVSILEDEYGPHPASLANDGNRGSNYHVAVGSCAASEMLEVNPWWYVDIGTPTVVFYVKVTNRNDAKGEEKS